MRKKVNRAAICSSENYQESKKLHINYLDEKHQHFKEVTINGEILIDTPILKGDSITNRFKTVRIFGRDMKVSIEEYNEHCAHLGL